ncbi:MAG TPA: CBS domain-containing protein [Polyangiaceae bacterium]|nr:CBS domain-containing protein [Polyangiaceae bacterium]
MTTTREILTEMAQARDEVRVKLHLLSLEAQDQWRELEIALENIELKLSQSGEELAGALRERSEKVIRAVRDFLGNQFGLSVPARSLMTPNVLTCLPGESLDQAARIFWERNCGAVPVVDAQGKLVGMLTDRNVCIAAYTQGRRLTDISVETVMSRTAHAASVDDSIERVLEIMADAQVRRVPIVDAEHRLVGMIALADLARWIRQLPSAHPSVGHALLAALSAISTAPGLIEHRAAAE